MNKTKIEWTRGPNGESGYTWNPIKGLCPVDCKTPDGKSYCYARAMYKRFGWDPRLNLDKTPIDHYGRIPDGSRIFVCSTMEMFLHGGPSAYRSHIFKEIEDHPNLTFIILTKRPENIDRPMPDNVWLGVSVTGGNQAAIDRLAALYGATARTKFVSIEPLLENPSPIFRDFMSTPPGRLDWAIVGRLTGHGAKYDPPPQWLGRLRVAFEFGGIPLFVKNNLAGIWPGPLIQEYPDCRAR